MIQKGETINGFRVEGLDDQTTFQNREVGIVAASLSGGTLGNIPQQVLLTDNATTLNILKKQRDPASRFNGSIISSFEAVGSSQLFTRLGLKVRKSGAAASFDTAVLMVNALTGEIVAETHESGPLPAGMGQGVMGEAAGRPVISAADIVFAAPYTLGRNNFQNRGIFRLTASQGLQRIVSDAMSAPVSPPASFQSFDKVSVDNFNKVAFRAIINAASDRNECITIAEGSRLRLVARKGAAVPGLQGSTFRSFEQLWATANGHVIFLAEINNPQPNPPRTRALCLGRPNGTLEVLIRQGELAPGTINGERISQIETLEGNSEAGTYAIIATITGGQQVLLAGDVTRTYAKPAMLLRQGGLVTLNGQATQVTSMRMTVASPIGCGGGSAINKSGVAVLVSLFDSIPHACVIDF